MCYLAKVQNIIGVRIGWKLGFEDGIVMGEGGVDERR